MPPQIQPKIRPATTSDIIKICTIEYSAVSKFRSIPALADLADSEVPNPLRVEEWLRVGRMWAAELPVQEVGAMEEGGQGFGDGVGGSDKGSSEGGQGDGGSGDKAEVVGFLAAYHKDSIIYIADISVHEKAQGRGVGSALLAAVFELARAEAAEASIGVHPQRQANNQTGDQPGHEDKLGSGSAKVSLTTYMDVPWNGPCYQKFGFREIEPEALGPEHVRKCRVDGEERGLVREGWRSGCMVWEGYWLSGRGVEGRMSDGL